MNNTEHTLKIRITGDNADIVGASKEAADSLEIVGVSSQRALQDIQNLSRDLNRQAALFGKSKQETRSFNVEQEILAKRLQLGTKATKTQITSFNQYAAKARESAAALNQLEQADAARTINKVGNASNRTTTELNQLNQASVRVSDSGHRLSGSYSLLRGVISGVGVSFAAMKMVETIGHTQALNLRVKELSGSTEAYLVNQEFLRESARDLRKDYFTLADSYSKLLALQKGGVITQKEGRKLLVGLSDASAALGASNAQLGQSLFGMSQGLSSAVVRAEELNQVMDPLPGLLQSVDKAAGLSAGGFRDLVNDGKVTNEFFKDILIKAFEDFQGAAERAGKTIPGVMTDISNAYAEIAAQLEQPVSAALVPVLEAVASGLRVLPEYVGEAKTLLTILTSYAAVRFLPPLIGSMTTRAYAAAKGFAVAGNSVDIYGAKLKTATVSQRVFNTALGALGGPVGIVSTLLLTAAFEILNYTSASDKAIESTRNWGKEIENTQGIFERFIETQKSAAKTNAKGLGLESAKLRYAEVATEVERLEKVTRRLVEVNASVARQQKAALQLTKAKAELAELTKTLGALTAEPKKAIEALEKLSKTLTNQAALFGKSKQEIRLLNTEQAILTERARLGTQATNAQVLSFEKFAVKARESALALNQLEKAQAAARQFDKDNKASGKVVDLAAERAKKLKAESDNYAASAALRDNDHQQRLAQISGNLAAENQLRLQQFELEKQQEQQYFANQRSLAAQRFEETQAELAERRLLAFENKLLGDEERREILAEIDAQQDQLEATRRSEKESATLIHEQNLTDIKQRQEEARARLAEQQRQRDSQGLQTFYSNMAELSQAGSKKLFKISKAVAIGQTIVNTYSAAQRAMAELSFPVNIAVAASTIAVGLARVKQIRKTSIGSSGSGSGISGGSLSATSSAPQASNVVPFSPPPQAQPIQTAATQQHNASNFQSGQTVIQVIMDGARFQGNDTRRQAEEVMEELENMSVKGDSRLAQSLKSEVVNG